MMEDTAQEAVLVNNLQTWFKKNLAKTRVHDWEVHTEYPLEHNMRVDLVLRRNAFQKRIIGIEVKIPGMNIHKVATGIGQVMLYRQFLSEAWLAIPNESIKEFDYFLRKIPRFKVLDTELHNLLVNGVAYDVLEYLHGNRRELNDLL